MGTLCSDGIVLVRACVGVCTHPGGTGTQAPARQRGCGLLPALMAIRVLNIILFLVSLKTGSSPPRALPRLSAWQLTASKKAVKHLEKIAEIRTVTLRVTLPPPPRNDPSSGSVRGKESPVVSLGDQPQARRKIRPIQRRPPGK